MEIDLQSANTMLEEVKSSKGMHNTANLEFFGHVYRNRDKVQNESSV